MITRPQQVFAQLVADYQRKGLSERQAAIAAFLFSVEGWSSRHAEKAAKHASE